MAILVEGPDNSGKSTLCEKLANHFHWPIERATRPLKSEDDMFDMCTQDIMLMQTSCIMDRSYIISDAIYGPLCRNQSLVDLRYWFAQIQTIQRTCGNFELIFCDGPDNVLANMSTHIVKITDTREHLAAVERNKMALISAYRNLRNAMHLTMDTRVVNPREKNAIPLLIESLERTLDV